MSILNILLLLSILTFAPLTHALEEALGTPTTVTSSPLAVPIAQAEGFEYTTLNLTPTGIMKRLSYANHPRPS